MELDMHMLITADVLYRSSVQSITYTAVYATSTVMHACVPILSCVIVNVYSGLYPKKNFGLLA